MTAAVCDECAQRVDLISRNIDAIEDHSLSKSRLRGVLALTPAELSRAFGVPLPSESPRQPAGAICLHNDGYPAALRKLPDAPAVLFSEGRSELLTTIGLAPAVAIVGARRATPYGLGVARSLARDLAAAGVTIISGLALGIDAAAHRGALDGGGTTIAVVGCGTDIPYPRANMRLRSELMQTGVVIGELPPGTTPRKWTFPARNRIIAALASVTVVVEGNERSGSLYTAEFARDIGHELAAVPGPITSPQSAGPNNLLFEGAHVVRGATDLLDLIFGVAVYQLVEPSVPPEHLIAVWQAVASGYGTLEAIVASGAASGASEALAALGGLEIEGWVVRDCLGAYAAEVAPPVLRPRGAPGAPGPSDNLSAQ